MSTKNGNGGKRLFGFDRMFDYNRDGKLGIFERAAKTHFINDVFMEEKKEPDFEENEFCEDEEFLEDEEEITDSDEFDE